MKLLSEEQWNLSHDFCFKLLFSHHNGLEFPISHDQHISDIFGLIFRLPLAPLTLNHVIEIHNNSLN